MTKDTRIICTHLGSEIARALLQNVVVWFRVPIQFGGFGIPLSEIALEGPQDIITVRVRGTAIAGGKQVPIKSILDV